MSTLTTHTTANRDSHSVGLCKFNTTTNAIEVSDGTNWRIYDPDSAVGWSGTNAYSMSFDGVDDYLTMSPVTPTAQQGTISLWVKIASTQNGGGMFSWSNLTSTGTTRPIFGVTTSGELDFLYQQQASGNEINRIRSTSAVNDGDWHHVAVTSNGSSWALYIDGTAASTTIPSGSNTGQWVGDVSSINSSYVAFTDIGGARRNPAIAGDGFFQGSIDEVAVWDSALSAAQINNIYKGESNGGSGGTNGTPGNLLSFSPNHWWRMGDGAEAGSGSTVYDMSNNSNNATIVNQATFDNTTAP